MKNKYALLLVHRGSLSLRRMCAACREADVTPFVLSDAPVTSEDRQAFERACRDLKVEYQIVDRGALCEDDLRDVLSSRPENWAFVLGLWDWQRHLMARMNEILGAADVREAAVNAVQDKLRFRQLLAAHGLTRLRPLSARQFLADGVAGLEAGPWIVKPRRGGGSVCTSIARSEADVREAVEVFDRGTVATDLFSEVYAGNELLVETYFEGQEFSLELLMQSGKCVLVLDHEKTRLTMTTTTVLEQSFASPCIGIDPEVIERARQTTLRCFELFDLHSGWFHVEMRVDGTGHLEFIEINVRPGGGHISESIRRQSTRNPLQEWVRLLLGMELHSVTERRCGTYQQLAYPQSTQPIASLARSSVVRPPDVLDELKKPGDICRVDREDIVALSLWETSLATHAEQVKQLSSVEFIEVIHSTAAPEAA